MTFEIKTLFPYPPDPLFDVGELVGTARTFSTTCDSVAGGMNDIISATGAHWEGLASDIATNRMRKFRDCVDDAARTLTDAKVAIDTYYWELNAIRNAIDELREEHQANWPQGPYEPCTTKDICSDLDNGRISRSLTKRWHESQTKLEAAVTTCIDALRNSRPDRDGLFPHEQVSHGTSP